MKNKITLALMCLFFIGASFAQQKRTCHAMESLESRMAADPGLKQRMAKIESFTQKRVKEMQNYQSKVEGNIITIPVVVHIIYKTNQENISVAQIQSQIDVLNEDFRRTNSDKTNKWSQAADTQIEFKLATIDPNGNPTTGITRKQTSKSTWSANGDPMKKSSSGGVDAWDTSAYLNMWVCNLGTSLLGYAQFPGGAAATDGVVMGTQYFGSKDKGSGFYLKDKFDKGRTTTHEVGHFLNLRHIWGDGGCNVDDFVSDTPNAGGANYGCKTGNNSCGSEDMVQNYMDYSDDACMNLFTQGQKNRMRAVLLAGGSRRSLALSDKFGNGGGGSSCTASVPTGVSISSVSSSAATVSWSAISNATYDLRYRKAGTSSWSTSAVSAITKSLSGLTASTQYQVQVRSKCSSGNSNYSASKTFTTSSVTISYCASKGNSVADEYIQRVQLGAINKTSTGGNGYSNHTAISTSLAKGASHTIKITPKWTGTKYNEGYAVFIDYNKDGDFSDSGEKVWTKSASKTSPVSGSFTIPNSATNGTTRMRVSMKYNGVPNACEAFSYGEVEDYTVVIGAAQADNQAPTAPASLTASNVAQTTLKLNWSASTDNVAVTGYDVYRGSTKIKSATSTSTNISGLTAATAYTFSVRAKDAAGNVSSSSNVVNVTTLSNQLSYCASKGNRVTYEWIDKVSFGGMINTSAANGGYKDFTSKVATVAKGSTNQLVISAGFASTAYNEYFTVWIDYNGDGDFTDNGEQVTTGNSSTAGNRTANITIPAGAKLGATRMRVSMKYDSKSSPCETFDDGEVEDYTVNITASNSREDVIVNGEGLTNRKVNDLLAYPNPAKDFIQVKLASKANTMTYKITNTIGRVVQKGNLNSSNLNVSNLNIGLYILQINDGQKSLTTKLVKK